MMFNGSSAAGIESFANKGWEIGTEGIDRNDTIKKIVSSRGAVVVGLINVTTSWHNSGDISIQELTSSQAFISQHVVPFFVQDEDNWCRCGRNLY